MFVSMDRSGGIKCLCVEENCIYRKIPLITITTIHSSSEGWPWLAQSLRGG
jgi:hypothetical protein